MTHANSQIRHMDHGYRFPKSVACGNSQIRDIRRARQNSVLKVRDIHAQPPFRINITDGVYTTAVRQIY
jgi:hypothetical protein